MSSYYNRATPPRGVERGIFCDFYCVSDKISFEIEYDDPKDLFFDIRGMGETNAMRERSRRPLHKKVLQDTLNFYKKNETTLLDNMSFFKIKVNYLENIT